MTDRSTVLSLSVEVIELMTIKQLTENYNVIAPKPIKKFETKDQGVKRLSQLVEAMRKAEPAPAPKVEKAEVEEDKAPSTKTTDAMVKKAKKEAIAEKKAEKAAPAPKVETAKVEAPKSISARCRELILAGKNNKEIWDIIQPEFDLDNAKKSYPAWNRSDMTRKGLITAKAA